VGHQNKAFSKLVVNTVTADRSYSKDAIKNVSA